MGASQTKLPTKAIYSHTGIRGIAAMYVFLFHLFWAGGDGALRANKFCQLFQWGGYSVDLFFVLSGFILNWVYLSETRVNWASYLKARVARILPLYYLTTLLSLPIVIYSFNKYGMAYLSKGFSFPREIVLNLFMVSGICNLPTLNGPAWSISVEFFCYLIVFPLLVVYSKKFAGDAKTFRLAIPIVLVAVLTYCAVTCYSAASIAIGGFQWNPAKLARGIFGFSAGFLLCSIFRSSSNWSPTAGSINLIISVVMATFLLIGLHCLPGYLSLCAFPFLVFFTATDRGVAASILKMNIFQWMGERSYSIYLWHAVCVTILHNNFMKKHLGEFLSCVIVIVFALCISELSYRWFECPAREFIRRIGRRSHSINKG